MPEIDKCQSDATLHNGNQEKEIKHSNSENYKNRQMNHARRPSWKNCGCKVGPVLSGWSNRAFEIQTKV